MEEVREAACPWGKGQLITRWKIISNSAGLNVACYSSGEFGFSRTYSIRAISLGLNEKVGASWSQVPENCLPKSLCWQEAVGKASMGSPSVFRVWGSITGSWGLWRFRHKHTLIPQFMSPNSVWGTVNVFLFESHCLITLPYLQLCGFVNNWNQSLKDNLWFFYESINLQKFTGPKAWW